MEDDKNSKENLELEKRVSKIELTTMEQEHRLIPMLKNIYEYGFDKSDKNKFVSSWKPLIYFFYKRQAITLVVAFTSSVFAILSCILAYQANDYLFNQNILLENQNERIDQQTFLLEAERRASFIFLLEGIFNRVTDELQNDSLASKSRTLSEETIAQIISLSHMTKPYYFLEEGKLIENELSPERGQLLIFLIESKLNQLTYKQIFDRANFTFSDLRNIKISNFKFENVSFFGSDFSNSTLENDTFVNCDFSSLMVGQSLISSALLHESRLTVA